MSFTSSLNPNFVVQTLSALVQAYASLLAIAGAFYIFRIERTRTDKIETERRLERSEEKFMQLLQRGIKYSEAIIVPINISDLREHLKKGDFDWVKSEITTGLSLINHGILYAELEDYIQNYDKNIELQKRSGLWIFNNFAFIFGYCCILLLGLIANLYAMSRWGLVQWVDYLFIFNLGASSFGFFLFFRTSVRLVIVKKESD